jgi:hypothetical protein
VSDTDTIPPTIHDLEARAADLATEVARLEADGADTTTVQEAKGRLKIAKAEVRQAKARARAAKESARGEDDDDQAPARDRIMEYAQHRFRYFRTVSGTVYAQRHGHPVARPIRAQGTTGSHRQELIVSMLRDGMGTFSGTALKESLDVLEALAMEAPVQQVHIRVATCGRAGDKRVTWLDLGHDDGLSVRISPDGWELRTPEPDEVVWRRTQLTGSLPVPKQGVGAEDGMSQLMGLCNFADAGAETLATAWLLGCLDPGLPVPAPFLTGPQGAGKSTSGRMLTRVIEGMSADLRRPPKDEESLVTTVAAGWISPLDNLSHLSADMSDLMSTIVTGIESTKRQLFTDGDVHRTHFRRPILLTGIDVGVIRADFAERLLPVHLDRPSVRRTEADLWWEYEQALPSVLGSLLDLAVMVRQVGAAAEVPTDLRMADFGQLCGQLDTAMGFTTLISYRALLDDLNDDVIEGDVLAQTVLQYMETQREDQVRLSSTAWLDTFTRLYCGSSDDAPYRPLPKGWPTTGKVLSDRLKRLQPTLAARGVIVEWGRLSRHESSSRARYIELSRKPTTVPPPRDQAQADVPSGF